MEVLPDPIGFSWDEGNIQKNLTKHNVTISEAEELFSTEPFVARYDAKHGGTKEVRCQALGKTKNGRRLFVAFTVRKKSVRVILVRDMTAKEEQAYERITNNS